jgi:putative membrane-bound dehydrogenase-like protein
MRHNGRALLSAATAALAFVACRRATEPPFTPRQALETFRIEKGFRIEPFAAEPDIQSPVAMEFDERGRIFVVEMPGYPLDTNPTGRIRLLEDTNGDGVPDRSTIFADGLVLPNGVMRWKKGILVTAAPDVLYLEDTNDDGRADVKRVVLTGFAFSNPQHTVNSPLYGLDNWIYLAHEGPAEAVVFKDLFGDKGREIRFADEPDAKGLVVGRHGVRFRPELHALEALAGSSQFGHSFDDWGRYFTEENWNHLRHEVIAARYFRRSSDLPVAGAMQDVSDHGRNAKVFAITKRPRFELLTEAGEFTSACALTVYTGGALPRELGSISFVAEPAQNLVHRDVLLPAGPTFTARRAQEGVEFLASTDSWFRPVNLTVGPDGALYVVDFYRKVIEHPEWASTGVATSPDLYLGRDRGRIYRVVPTGVALPRPGRIDLGHASDVELVTFLQSPNLWWRRTAQRLLVDRGHPQVKSLLEALFAKSTFGLARLHALWTLEGLGLLDEPTIQSALDDREPGVRENALRLAEPRLSASPALAAKVLSLAGDSDARVRFQVLCALGLVDTPAARLAVDRLLREGIEDRWVQLAALLASPDRISTLLAAAMEPRTGLATRESPGRAGFFRLASAAVGARRRGAEVRRLLVALTRPGGAIDDWWKTACLEGLAGATEAARGEATTLRTNTDLLLRLFGTASPQVRHAALRLLQVGGVPASPDLGPLRERARAVASSGAESAESRADAIDFLALSPGGSAADWLEILVDPREPEPVQAAAVRGLGRLPGKEPGQFLLRHWRSLTPGVRGEAASALLADPGRTRALVAAIAAGQVQAWTLDFDQKRDIIMNADPEIRRLGRPLLEAAPADRQAVIARYEAALDRGGDVARGKQVFGQVCAKCHRLDGTGAEVGPELGTVRNRAPEVLLADILMPSRSIAQKYESYLIETAGGETETGVMAAESPTSVVLRREGGKESVIARKDIRKMSVSNLSAMPGDLENQIDPAQMADVIAYLKKR